MVRIMGLGAFAGFAIATIWALALVKLACGQSPSGPYPKFKDGVGRLPPALTVGAPPALIPVFDAPSSERDAAPLYLDALFEFSGEMFSCFPEGPDRERRKKLAEDGVPIANGQKTTIWAENPAFPAVDLLDTYQYLLTFMNFKSFL